MDAVLASRASGASREFPNMNLNDFGAYAERPSYSPAEAMKLMAEFQSDLHKALKRDKNPEEIADVQKGISPEIGAYLSAYNANAAQNVQLAQMVKILQELKPDLAKDLSITSPLASGFVPYDLRAPSLKIFPALTPLRNRIPRTQGQGKAYQYKRITGITGSGTGVADTRPFFGEVPQTTGWGTFGQGGGLTLARPSRISYAADEKTVTYRFFGLSDSVSFGSDLVSRGYESMRALSSFSLMKAVMLMEEKGIVGGRATALVAPAGTPTGAARAASATETAITGASTNVYLKATAVAQFGETVGSTASAAVAPTGGQVIDWTLPNDSIQAFGYNLYVSTAAGADPGDGSRFFLAFTAWRKFTQQGVFPTTVAIPGADSGTSGTNDWDGIFALIDSGPGYNGVLNGRRFNAAPTATMFDADLAAGWDAFKADPDEIFTHGTDRVDISNAIIAVGSQNQAYRILLTPNDQGSVIAGGVVGSFLNKVTGKEIKLTVHPWFRQGNALVLSWALPYAWSEVQNTIEMRLVQDYLQIDWPVIQLSYDSSILGLGAPILYAPAYMASYHGLAVSDTGTFK